jgi:hypothetical protein
MEFHCQYQEAIMGKTVIPTSQSPNPMHPQPINASPMLNLGRNNRQTDNAMTTLNAALMKKTFGELVRNYIKNVLAAVPADNPELKQRLVFLNNNQEVALVGLAGHDTWITPIEKLGQAQVEAGLRALSWLSTELVYRLSNTAQAVQGNARPTVIPNDPQAYDNFIAAVNSLSPLRGALVTRDQQLEVRQHYYHHSPGVSSSFGDVYLTWNPSCHGYYYQPCYYDFHHGHYHHHRGVFDWGHGHYAHCHGDPFPVAHALGEHVIAPAIENMAHLYSNLFDLQVNLVGDAIRIGGHAIEAIADGAGHAASEAAQLLGDASHHAVHATGHCFEHLGHCIGHGCHDVLSVAGHVAHDAGDFLGNVIGGCGDVLQGCGHIGMELLKCDCKGCDGADGEGCGAILGAIGSCCYGIGACISNLCCDKKHPANDGSGAPPSYAEATGDFSGHEHYTAVTTAGTAIYWTVAGIPLVYKTGQDLMSVFSSQESERNQSAARRDLCFSALCIGALEGAGFMIAPQVMGPRVIGNLAISAGTCGRAATYIARVKSETNDNFGITHADKYFLTAAQLNTLVNAQPIQGRQAGRDDSVSKLDFILRQNTLYWKEAVSAKNEQNTFARRTRHFVSCGGYGCANNNASEMTRNNALANISQMKQGTMPVSHNPPPYAQQPFTRHSRGSISTLSATSH